MGTNNFQTKNPGDIISADDPNQYKIGLDGDVVPRNASGVPTDQAGSLGSSTYSWLNGFFRKIFPGNPANNHTITSDSNGILLNPGDVSSFRVRKTGTPSTPVDFYNAANDFTMSVGGTAAGGYTAAAGQLLPKLRSQTFTASGTWSIASANQVLGGYVFLHGCGGGGGGGGSNGNWPGGGGAGSRAVFMPFQLGGDNEIVITIGAGGGGSAGGSANRGTSGGTSTAVSFSRSVSFLGGLGGVAGLTGGGGAVDGGESDSNGGLYYQKGGDGNGGATNGSAGVRSPAGTAGTGGTLSGGLGGGGGGGGGGFGNGANGGNGNVAGGTAAANTGGGGGGAGGNSLAGGTGGSGRVIVFWFDSKDFS